MRKIGLLGLAAACFLTAAATASTASAQTKSPAVKIAVVDVQRVQRSSRAMKGIRTGLQKLRVKYNKEFVKREKEMQAEYSRLRKDKDMSRAEYERRVRALQADLVKLRRQSRARSRALSQSFQKSFTKFRQEVILVVKSMAVEDGFTLVLNQVTLIHSAPQYDITDKVILRLNKRLPKLGMNYKDPVRSARDVVSDKRKKARRTKKKKKK